MNLSCIECTANLQLTKLECLPYSCSIYFGLLHNASLYFFALAITLIIGEMVSEFQVFS